MPRIDCEACQAEADRLQSLYHRHPKSASNVRCVTCDRDFVNLAALDSHIRDSQRHNLNACKNCKHQTSHSAESSLTQRTAESFVNPICESSSTLLSLKDHLGASKGVKLEDLCLRWCEPCRRLEISHEFRMSSPSSVVADGKSLGSNSPNEKNILKNGVDNNSNMSEDQTSHLSSTIGQEIKYVMCPICGTSWEDTTEFAFHLITTHGGGNKSEMTATILRQQLAKKAEFETAEQTRIVAGAAKKREAEKHLHEAREVLEVNMEKKYLQDKKHMEAQMRLQSSEPLARDKTPGVNEVELAWQRKEASTDNKRATVNPIQNPKPKGAVSPRKWAEVTTLVQKNAWDNAEADRLALEKQIVSIDQKLTQFNAQLLKDPFDAQSGQFQHQKKAEFVALKHQREDVARKLATAIRLVEEKALAKKKHTEDANRAKIADLDKQMMEANQARRAEKALVAEQARCVEEARVAEQAHRVEEARRFMEARRIEEARAVEEARAAEQIRVAEQARRAEEARVVEQARQVEEARAAEQATRRAEDARLAEQARIAEDARCAEDARAAEDARLAEDARIAEEARVAEDARIAEEARVAEEARIAEQAKVAARQKFFEEQLKREEESRLAHEAQLAAAKQEFLEKLKARQKQLDTEREERLRTEEETMAAAAKKVSNSEQLEDSKKVSDADQAKAFAEKKATQARKAQMRTITAEQEAKIKSLAEEQRKNWEAKFHPRGTRKSDQIRKPTAEKAPATPVKTEGNTVNKATIPLQNENSNPATIKSEQDTVATPRKKAAKGTDAASKNAITKQASPEIDQAALLARIAAIAAARREEAALRTRVAAMSIDGAADSDMLEGPAAQSVKAPSNDVSRSKCDDKDSDTEDLITF